MPRVVVVTGSSAGIGLATCLAFARAGDTVVATLRDPARGAALTAAAAAEDLALEVAVLDVTDQASVDGALAGVLDRHGRLDVVVNNAGLGYAGTLEELTIDDLARAMDVNCYGPARVTKAVLPVMRAAGGGRVIALSSIGGALGQPFNDAYCAAKFALEGLYESLHPVAAAFGVHVSLVEPGPVAGEFRERSGGVDGRAAQGPFAQLWQRFFAVSDAGFAAAQTPEEVAAVVLAVADDPAPRLRYQTAPGVEKLVGLKLADLDGSRVTRLTAKWLAGPG